MASVRNPYTSGVDFNALALQSTSFAKHLKSNGQLDFTKPEAVKELTKSLLKRDFDLTVELPDDRLCPPVENRLNYILWLQDILDTTSDTYRDRYDPNRDVVGLDIGTGASCIYPLLGCTQRPKWRFAATDIDGKNLQYAQENVQRNKLQSRIRVVSSTTNGPLIPLDSIGLERADFCMCNPPFYTSVDELVSSAEKKLRTPFSACTGAEVEMVTPGGEVAFLERMIQESLTLRERVQWYTSMLGKLSSVSTVAARLKEVGVLNWAVAEFTQGTKTRRWAVAWSWENLRPPTHVSRGIQGSGVPKEVLPFPAEYEFKVGPSIALMPSHHQSTLTQNQVFSLETIGDRLNILMQTLDIQWQWRQALSTGVGFAAGDVWSRAARRRKTARKGSIAPDTSISDENSDDDEDEDMNFGFKIQLHIGTDPSGGITVTLRWLKGNDRVLFESFCGFLRRSIIDK